MPRVLFLPDNVEVEVDPGENLLRAALGGAVHLYAACGGAGTCGKCRVIISSGAVKGGKSAKLSPEEISQGYVLACLTTVTEDITVQIPPESSLTHIKPPDEKRVTVLGETVLSGRSFEDRLPEHEIAPALKKYFVSMTPPSLDDATSDLGRIEREFAAQHGIVPIDISIDLLRQIPELVRAAGWQITLTVFSAAANPREHRRVTHKVVAIEAGDTTARQFGMALDIGTTTCVAELVDLTTGKVIAKASAYNAQIAHGDDVITRIVAANRPGGLQVLQSAVIGTINGLLDDIEAKTSDALAVRRSEISYIVAAGNTTMTQLLMAIPPRYVREEPYIPTATYYPPVSAREIGIDVAPEALIYAFPCIASYVGGDIVAGILASGVSEQDKLTLFIDMGTNGEMVLGNKEWMMTCACSAGPAFEGGGVKNGMRAAKGAIELVRVDPITKEPTIFTVGQSRPLGICGSGLINAISELFLSGILGPDGTLEAVTKRVRTGDETGENEYVLCAADDSGTGQDIVLTENDIENLKRAKGAIFAGMTTLLASLDLPLEAIEEVLIAGGFGNYIDVSKATSIGLMPELPSDRFAFVGNGSLLGARLALISEPLRVKAGEIAQRFTYLELSHVSTYMDHYMSALFIPHTDLSLFPNVMKARQANLDESVKNTEFI